MRKDLDFTKVEQLKGLKIANQTGSSVGNIFVDQIAPAAGLKKGDFQEVRMDVNNMMTALSAKTVDAMVNVEPYNEIADADGFGTSLMDYSSIDQMPVFMAATPDFVAEESRTRSSPISRPGWRSRATSRTIPTRSPTRSTRFFTSKGYTLSQETFARRWRASTSSPGFPPDLKPYMQQHAEILLREKKIDAIPDWKKALRPELWAKAAS